jgi:YHS domain-containing protein
MNEHEMSNQNQSAQPPDELIQDSLDPNPAELDDQDLRSMNMARDPVCGGLVSKATATNTLPAPINDQGEGTIYFDSPECKELYEEDPEKYGSSF